MKRFKCPECGSKRVVLLEDNEIEPASDGTGVWRADLNCGKCGHNIYEFGV